jgi:arylsulfatase A-like enzyme
MRHVALSLLPVLTLLGPAAQQPPRDSPWPNVVLIVTDDVGYGDIGSYGAPDIKTPNIDRLAREGVRLTDFYANGATCSPTRAGLITGRYQQRVIIERPLGTGGRAAEQGLPVKGRSFPQLMKDSGYATGLVGKWHLGYKPEFGPNAHGFDYFFGFLSGFIDYYKHTGGDGRPDLFENTTPVLQEGYMTDLITEHSVRFITENATRQFFLEVTYNAAHWPYQRPDHPSVAPNNAAHQGATDDPPATRQDYVAMLERADQGVGRILATIEAQGLTRNTLVIFTNDNGGEWLSRNAPLFHHKDTLWEGGIRVPAIFKWPGGLPAGKTSAQVGITMDLTASILAAAGAKVPADARLEGIDLLPILRGQQPAVERTLFWRNAVPGRQQRAVRRGDWKLLVDGGEWELLLFNLKNDIGERTNLAVARPALVAELRRLIREWERDVDTEGKGAR